jgi:UDP-2-acetamido-3-amino-2,3-dideoxy-glucuronate N-acetyltransferase
MCGEHQVLGSLTAGRPVTSRAGRRCKLAQPASRLVVPRYVRMSTDAILIHPTAEVSKDAAIGAGTQIWHQAQVREGAILGKRCILGKGAYVDKCVRIGDYCKLQNGVFVFHGFNLEDGVFLGPGVMLLNDKHPRAINPDGSAKSDTDWTASEGLVGYGAAVGGGAVILPGVHIGRMAMVGSGAVVTRDVPERGIVVGNPARLRAFACDCGHTLALRQVEGLPNVHSCATCGRTYEIPTDTHAEIDVQTSK